MSDNIEVEKSKRLCVTNMMNQGEKNSQNMENRSVSILNDYCVLQILNRLDVGDLCNVVNLNKQFKRVSMMSFSGRNETFCYPKHLQVVLPHSSETYRSQMRRVLCNFGHLIKSLKLIDFYPAGVFTGIRIYPIEMDVISKYCAGTLAELKLKIFLHFDCGSAKPLFATLKTLKIDISGGFKGDANALLSDCRELKTLILKSVPYTLSEVSEVAQKYPKLEELYIGTVVINAKTTVALLQSNPQIKKMDVYDTNASKTITTVASQMVNLKELILRCELNDYDNINELGKLQSLTMLELHDVEYEFVPAIEAMQNIEHLKWFGCPSNVEFTNHITKLKTLKSLALKTISSPFDDVLMKLGEQLPLLDTLELGFKHQEKSLFSIGRLITFVERSTKLNVLVIHTVHSDLFGQRFYNSLLEVIRKRSNENKLQVRIYGNVSTSLRMDSDLLCVEILADNESCFCSYCEPPDSNDIHFFDDDFGDDDDDYDYDYDLL